MVSPGLLLSATPPRATPPAHRVTAGSVQGSTPTSSFANLISFIKTKGWTITDTKVWAEPLAVKVADPELGEEKVRADSWSGRFKSPWLRLVLDKEGCVEASPQPESVSVCVCVCVCVCMCVCMCVCVLGRHSEEEAFASQEKSSHLKSNSEEN